VRALDKDEDAPFAATFSHYFNRNNYLSWLATTILLGNPDTINQNFGLYQPRARRSSTSCPGTTTMPWPSTTSRASITSTWKS
jgi:hypothetical protein